MLNSTTIGQINKALENSFANIKKDINDIKVSVGLQAEKYSKSLKTIEEVKSNSVTNDKLNVLKIKIGELNEELKKVWDMEKKINLMKEAPKKTLSDDINQLNTKLIALELRMKEATKQLVSETQLKALVTEVNSELNKLSQEIKKMDDERNYVRREELDDYAVKVSKKLTDVNQDLLNLKGIVKNNANRDEVKSIVTDVKKEIASVRKSNENCVKKDEIQALLGKINDEFDGISGELSSLKDKNKNLITVSQAKNLVNDISNEFEDIRSEYAGLNKLKTAADKIREVSYARKEIETLREKLTEAKKEIKNTYLPKDKYRNDLRGLKREMDYADKYEEVVLDNNKTGKIIKAKPQKLKITGAFGKFMIFVSFILLIVSIICYITQEQMLMDQFAVSAVVAFIIGLALKIFVTLKN